MFGKYARYNLPYSRISKHYDKEQHGIYKKKIVTLRRKKHFNKRENKNIKLKLLKTIKNIKL